MVKVFVNNTVDFQKKFMFNFCTFFLLGNSFSALVICLKLYQKQNGALSYLEFMPNDILIKAFFHADDQVLYELN